MVSIDFVLYVLAFLCFLLDVAARPKINANLASLGLALLTLSLLI
jgi:hypothetical protein